MSGGGLNGLDYVIVVSAVVGTIYGLGRGALRMVTSVAAVIAAIYVASLYYGVAANLLVKILSMNPELAATLGYAALFLVVMLALGALGDNVVTMMREMDLGWLDRMAGSLLGIVVALLWSGLLIMLLTAVLPPEAAFLRESQLAPRVMAYDTALVGFIPKEIRQSYEERRQKLMDYWAQIPVPVPKPSPASGSGSGRQHQT